MATTREQLRGRRELGLLFGMSPNRAVQRLGAADAGFAERQLLQTPRHVGRGVFVDPVTGESTVNAEFLAQVKAEQDRALELEERKYQRALAKEYRQAARVDARAAAQREATLDAARISAGKLSAGERKFVKGVDANLRLGAQTIAGLRQHPGAVAPLADTASAGLSEIPGVGNYLAARVRDAAKTEDEQKWRDRLNRWVEGIRRDEAGANLTQIEIALGADRWDPTAPGLSYAQAMSRAETLYDYLYNQRLGYAQQVPIADDLRPGRVFTSADDAPAPVAAPLASPQAGAPAPAPAGGVYTVEGRRFARGPDGAWVELDR